MEKLDFSNFWKCCCVILVLLSTTGFSDAQIILARNATRSSRASYSSTQEENKVLLKDVLDNLKKQFNVKIAYQEGLLNNKYVPENIVIDLKTSSLDHVLEEILAGTNLDYKQINANQISIFQNDDAKKTSAAADFPIRGKVLAGTESIPGASVYLKGDPKIGTVTDNTGNFNLSVPDRFRGSSVTLVVAFIGYARQEITVTDFNEVVRVSLVSSDRNLNEVVVTALGINRERKSIGYALTEVKGSEFTKARENNVANGLAGKVAGVNVAGISTGPGGSSRVLIRGNGSLGSDNQPLYVINGMPMDNTTPGGSATAGGGYNNIDRGDGIGGINPDDIETMTVLKGGQAAALYGSRASNGVILITTKKGRAQKGVGIEFNSTATLETITSLPDFQYQYGQGDGGVKPTDLASSQNTGRRSFGSKLDGSTDYVGVDGKTHPYIAQKDNFKHFYKTGQTYTNSLAFLGGNEAIQYRFSASELNGLAILPGQTYDRKTFNLSINAKLSKKVSVEAVAQYNIETGHNRTSAGDADGNPNWSPYQIGTSADIRWLAPGYDKSGNEIIWNDAAIATNSYFVINKFQENDLKNRFIGQGTIAYEPIKDLVLKATASRDFYSYSFSHIEPTGTAYTPQGQYTGFRSNVSETNVLLSATYKHQIYKDLGFNVMVGTNNQKHINDELDQNGSIWTIPFFYAFSNLASSTSLPDYSATAINSVFGSADLDFKSWLFITATARQDWFSTLSLSSNHILYPSVGGSFVASEAFHLPEVISYLKLRGSYAVVGGGAPGAYSIQQAFVINPSSGQPLQQVSGTSVPNQFLKPYSTATTEAGIEAQLFHNRLGFDLNFYDRETTNDIVNATISQASGYQSALINIGKLQNKGIELALNGTPVRGNHFTWNVSYNFAYNKSKVVALIPGLNNIISDQSVNGYASIQNIVGQPFGTLVGTSVMKNATGQTVYSTASGYAVATAPHPIGNSVAPTTMGLTNDFHFGRFSFNFLLDGKFGNKVFSEMEVYAMRLGKLKATLPGRDNGVQLSGVTQAGAPYTGTIPVSNIRLYYDNNKAFSDEFIHDGSFIKLRSAIFSYSIPVGGLKKIGINSMDISAVGRNLLILVRHTPNFDPESSYTNGASQGFESTGLPKTRSFGLNFTVKF